MKMIKDYMMKLDLFLKKFLKAGKVCFFLSVSSMIIVA